MRTNAFSATLRTSFPRVTKQGRSPGPSSGAVPILKSAPVNARAAANPTRVLKKCMFVSSPHWTERPRTFFPRPALRLAGNRKDHVLIVRLRDCHRHPGGQACAERIWIVEIAGWRIQPRNQRIASRSDAANLKLPIWIRPAGPVILQAPPWLLRNQHQVRSTPHAPVGAEHAPR